MRDEQTNNRTVKIELFSQLKLEAEFRKIYIVCVNVSPYIMKGESQQSGRSPEKSPYDSSSLLSTYEHESEKINCINYIAKKRRHLRVQHEIC